MAQIDDEMPTFAGLLTGMRLAFLEFGTDWEKYPVAYDGLRMRLTEFDGGNIVLAVAVAVIMTLVRVVLTKSVYQPLYRWLKVDAKNATKFNESIWKATAYSVMWYYILHVVILSGRYDFFYYPCAVFNGSIGLNFPKQMPFDIYVMYLWEIGFYLHGVYSVLCMDVWRKDSLMMLFHHLLTLSLLWFSFCMRYYLIGALVLFLHDISDIFLETCKLFVYMRHRNGQNYKLIGHLSNIMFVGFASSWFLCRLYWYPLKVLHTTNWCVYKAQKAPNNPWMYLPFNGMLIALQLLNLYWFAFIVGLIIRIATGRMSEVEDLREYDVEGTQKKDKEVNKRQAQKHGNNSECEVVRYRNK